MQRLGAGSDDSNTAISLLTPPVPESKFDKEEKPADKEPVKETTEESLTPPLLPSMKLQVDEKKDESKQKPKEWDMFAEQDIFKADTNVCLIS